MFIYIIIFLMTIDLVLKTKKSLHMLQQNLYNENNRYVKWVIKNKSEFLNIEIINIILYAIILNVYTMSNYSIIIYVLLILLYLMAILLLKKKIDNEKLKEKKPLVITKRIKRLIVTITILYLIPVVVLSINNDIKLSLIMTLIFAIMLYLNSVVVFIANIVNYPVERLVYYHYKRMAQTKLNNMTNLKVIGITGSYGKTSSKNILADILNIKYNALPTPKNLNTYNGLIMTVNNYLDKFTDIFIAEMGAYVKGEIKGLCNLVHPKYGILTTIGTAHLESFGSEENIQKGKFELIESLPKDGIGVLNGDDPKQVNYKLKNNVEIIWIGIENKNVDVRATNIKCSNVGTEFDVIFKNDKKKYHFVTKLLGSHNVYNILAGIALGRKFDIEIEDLQRAVKNVKPVEHRLELKRLGSFYMIDDAYNSNPVGAKNAVSVLGMMPGTKIVVTPGMIELGDKEEKENMIFGEEIANVADYVVLVGEEKTKPILKGLKNKGYKEENIIIYNDVREAYKFINGIVSKSNKDVYALFENDLPDMYNE